jgi:hypothetical protein
MKDIDDPIVEELPLPEHQQLDALGHRAGAALRAAAPAPRIDAFLGLAEQGRRRRTAAAAIIVSALILAGFGGLLLRASRTEHPPVDTVPRPSVTTVNPALAALAQAALLTPQELPAASWTTTATDPQFPMDPSFPQSVPSCAPLATKIFDRFHDAQIATRSFTDGTTNVNEFIAVFPGRVPLDALRGLEGFTQVDADARGLCTHALDPFLDFDTRLLSAPFLYAALVKGGWTVGPDGQTISNSAMTILVDSYINVLVVLEVDQPSPSLGPLHMGGIFSQHIRDTVERAKSSTSNGAATATS